jgi:hypothetical protein
MTSISIIDYLGKVRDGVGVVISINVDDQIYQSVFWFNKDCKYVLSVDDDLLKFLEVDSIYDYENLEELLEKIFLELPPAKELFDKFEIN